jgi:2,3-bisphosphoglycerate-dependent phosphoglycerate mutase
MSRITLVRHGETTWNAMNKVQGQLESPLSPRGIEQAQALARRLQHETFDALYASDLARARDTAQKIADLSGHDIVVDTRLRERHYGMFQGLTWDEIRQRHPAEYAHYKGRFPNVTIPGGESADEFFGRVLEVLGEISARHEHALVVAHGGLVDVVYREAMRLDREAPRDYPLPNASVNRFHYDGAWKVEAFGDIEHLEADSLDDN